MIDIHQHWNLLLFHKFRRRHSCDFLEQAAEDDKAGVIPYDIMESFFKENLKKD